MTEVEFAIGNEVVTLRPSMPGDAPRPTIDLVVARMRGGAGKGMSTDELMALTRGDD